MHRDTSPLLGNRSIRYNGVEVKTVARELGKAAADAALREVLTAPKPGLVDPLGPGCHSDMDWRTFVKSGEALAPFWQEQAMTGLNGTSPELAFTALRSVGVEMEHAMFEATGGINTHKGLIYLMSLLLYGTGRAIATGEAPEPATAARYAAEAAAGSVARNLAPLKQCRDISSLSHGEKLYVLHGITGIRGEAEAAFPSVLRGGLPELARAESSGASENDAALAALLGIMEINEDSNVIHRGGYDFWRGEYRKLVKITRESFSPASGDYAPIVELESRFMPLRISPGGAADLLSCTLFLKNSKTCLLI